MKKFIINSLIILSIKLFAVEATFQNIQQLQYKNIPIIDIRLPSEWKSTGTIPNVYKITFFDRLGNINPAFIDTLNKYKITKISKFALICRTGHRSRIATQILQQKGYSNIINLEGGMFRLFQSLLKKDFTHKIHSYKK